MNLGGGCQITTGLPSSLCITYLCRVITSVFSHPFAYPTLCLQKRPVICATLMRRLCSTSSGRPLLPHLTLWTSLVWGIQYRIKSSGGLVLKCCVFIAVSIPGELKETMCPVAQAPQDWLVLLGVTVVRNTHKHENTGVLCSRNKDICYGSVYETSR